ncbi:uncharacterized protein B0T23DRAFT_431165 [Neurospora hispaniola]|uniref:Uncharacterized protein n=1 Tax=Neurospora hispaniola TaxID=588809 RepID=A0AAJ0I1X7_9PEZI|nr:hypothetical protein B0T23DRAFT_431165 [Neurospora hispaniola]
MSSHNAVNQTTANRYEISVWHEIKDYIDASLSPTTECSPSPIPFALCPLCREELDIQGIPPTSKTVVRHPGCVLPCGHFFGITCWKAWVRDYQAEPTKHYIGPNNPIPVAGIREGRRLTTMDLAECHKYGQSKPYRKFECPVCRTDLHYTGCCCEVRPAIIPTNKSTCSIACLLALPKTFLEVSRDAPTARLDQDTTVDGTDVRQDTTDASQDSSDEEKDCSDSDENVADKVNDMEDDEIIANYRHNITPAANNDNYIERKTAGSPRFSQQGPNGAIRILTPRPVIYDINSIRQPGFYPVMRLRAQYPDLNNPKGWDCRIVGGRLSDVVDPVCGQRMYDLTRYRWLKNKYDEIEPQWRDYEAPGATVPANLPGAGLNQFPGVSWKLAVSAVYLSAGQDANGGLKLSDMEGMGEYPDWDERLEQPEWQARGVSKIPRDHWGHGPRHVMGRWMPGHGKIIFQTDKFSYCALH